MTQKETIWLNEYLKCWNATEAARRAGYKWPDKQGQEKKAKFADAIQERIEAVKMDADEVLIRLSEQARGDVSEFLRFVDGVKDPFLDLKQAKEKGLLKLVKKFKYNYDGRPEIELYDAQSALQLLGKHLGLFTDRVEHEHTGQLEVKVVGGVNLDDV